MRTEDLNLSMIDNQLHLVVSGEIVSAVSFASRLGYGPSTAYRFVTALVMTNRLGNRSEWYPVLNKIKDLQLQEKIATLNAGRPVVGDVEP